MRTFSLITLFLLFISVNLHAQSMEPPKPLENAVYESMVGEWKGVGEMMGGKQDETLKCYWDLNHQFLIMELESVSQTVPGQIYHGKGVYGVSSDGNAVIWWFDSWGADGVLQSTGTFDGMKITMAGENMWYKDNRTIEWNEDGQMIMKWNGIVKMPTGDMEMSGETVYTKQ